MSESKPYGGDYQAPYDSPGEKRGMSGCAKAFLIIGGLGIAALLACCVGGWFYMRNAIVTEPMEVQSVANEIIDWEFNDELNGQFAARFFFARIAALSDPAKGFIMVVDSRYMDAKDMGERMDEQFRGQMESDEDLLEDTEIIEEGEREVVIGGETFRLQFNKTRGKESGKEYWEILAIVPGKEHLAFVMLKVLGDVYDEAEILRRFENLK